jgi:hypothetical protein
MGFVGLTVSSEHRSSALSNQEHRAWLMGHHLGARPAAPAPAPSGFGSLGLWPLVGCLPWPLLLPELSNLGPSRIKVRFSLALQRKSGPRIALPAHRLYYPVDIWRRSTTRGFCGDLRVSEVLRDQHTARARAATAVPATASSCAASCFVARVRASREEKTASPIPAESHVAGCMPAARKEAI